jgi:hypothetical protein
MAREGVVAMSKREIRRVGVIQQVLNRRLKQVVAAKILEISERQIRRLVKAVKGEGVIGLAHKNRGRKGNRRIKDHTRNKILTIFHKKYPDFGPTLASEKLLELDKLTVHRDTLRRWLIGEGNKCEWQRKKRLHRKWRERKECFGEMVQMDGSHHDWLEGRGPKLVLMGYVDDATGEKFGEFYLYEGTAPALGSFNGYVKKYGVPMSVYLDRHSTYKTVRHQTIFEELNDRKALTQFERAMKELGVRVIHAYSAPAKGRVENMFKTLQDRLVKEMRLAGINTLEEANKFLEGYLAKYNKRFKVLAKNTANLHRKKPPKHDLDAILCRKEEYSLRKDSTVHYDNRLFLVTNRITRRASKVTVEERLDGTIRIKHQDCYLNYKEVEPSIRVGKEEVIYNKPKMKGRKRKKSSKPGKDHPWRKFKFNRCMGSCDYESLEKEKALINA